MNSSQSDVSKRKPVRVFVDGCFDMFHYGHANALRQAKQLGDQLIVGVHSDAEVLKFKGPPVYSEQERYKLIRSIKWIDEMIPDIPYIFDKTILDIHNCDFVAHGDDVCLKSDGSHVYEAAIAINRYKEFRRTEGVSTTDLVSRILARIEAMRTRREQSFYIGPSKLVPSVNTLRRYCSMDSLEVKENGTPPLLEKTHVESEATNQNSTVQEYGSNNDSPGFSYSNCGMSYIPNVFRIAQFCLDGQALSGIREPKMDDIVVYVPGTYDLFHVGHVSFFESCLKLGTYLLVGLHSNKNASFESGRMGSIMTIQERVLSVLSCRYVNNVIIDAPYEVPGALLDHFKVNYVAVGKDTQLWPTKSNRDPMHVPKERGIFRRVDSHSNVTTRTIINRILESRGYYEERNKRKQESERKIFARLADLKIDQRGEKVDQFSDLLNIKQNGI